MADFVRYRVFIYFFQVFDDIGGLSNFFSSIPGVYQSEIDNGIEGKKIDKSPV